jgi:hypothetical protein
MPQTVREAPTQPGCPALPLFSRLAEKAALLSRLLPGIGMLGHRDFGGKNIYGVHWVFLLVAHASDLDLVSGAKIINAHIQYSNIQFKFCQYLN